MRKVVFFFGLTVTVGLAQDDKPNLSGTWQLDPGKSEIHGGKAQIATWVIKEDGQNIEIKQVNSEGGTQRKVDLVCVIGGKECSFKEPEGTAKASFWYNGPMLVEMKTSGRNDRIDKYRMKLAEDGKTLRVELMAIVPPSPEKPEQLVFTKQQ